MNNGAKCYETSKIIVEFAYACRVSHLLGIKHNGARRSLILQAMRRQFADFVDYKVETMKRIDFRQIPIKSGGLVIGYI